MSRSRIEEEGQRTDHPSGRHKRSFWPPARIANKPSPSFPLLVKDVSASCSRATDWTRELLAGAGALRQAKARESVPFGQTFLGARGSGDRPSRPAAPHPLPETYLTHSMKATGGWARKSAQYSGPNSRRPSGDTSGACQRTSRRPAERNASSIVPTLR